MAMTKATFINLLAAMAGIDQKAAAKAVEAAIKLIRDEVEGEGRFELPPLGTFKKSFRQEKAAPGFGKGQGEMVPAHYGIKFKPAPAFKEQLNPKKE